MATLTKTEQRLTIRLQRWQREAQRVYELSSIPSIANYRYGYVMAMQDYCYETVLSEACDLYKRLCPGSTEVWLGGVLLCKALYNYPAYENLVALPSENTFYSHDDDFGPADGAEPFELSDDCDLLYFCASARRVAFFDKAAREWHSAGFRFSSPASPNTTWLVRDGADDSILRCFLHSSADYGTEFLLPVLEGLSQTEVESL